MTTQDTTFKISADTTRNSLHTTNSVFSGHTLKPVHNSPILRNYTPTYWQGIVLFFIFSIYILTRVSEPRKIIKIFTSVFSLQESKQLFREEYKLTKRLSVILAIGFILVIAMLLQFTNNYFDFILTDAAPFTQFLFFAAVVVFMYTIKFGCNYIFSFVSETNDLAKEYLFNVSVFSQTLGIVIFPLIICLQLTTYPAEWFLYPAIIICGGFYALRAFRTVILSVGEQNVGIVYIFLYFCALEILPMLVLIKFLLVNF